MPHSFTSVPASLYVASAWLASKRRKEGRLAVMLRGTATVMLPLARPVTTGSTVPGAAVAAGALSATTASADDGSFFFSSAHTRCTGGGGGGVRELTSCAVDSAAVDSAAEENPE